jgi:hypothetical protein
MILERDRKASPPEHLKRRHVEVYASTAELLRYSLTQHAHIHHGT